MPRSLRARSSTAVRPCFRSATSALICALRSTRTAFSAAWFSTAWRKCQTSRIPSSDTHRRYCRRSSAARSVATTNFMGPAAYHVPWACNSRRLAAFHRKCVAARVPRPRSELLLDPEQLVVLGHSVRTRQRAGLDLGRRRADRDVRDRRVLGLAGTMRYDRRVSGPGRHVDRLQSFGQRPDLVRLDQDRVCHVLGDAARGGHGVCDEQVEVDTLHLQYGTLSKARPE